MLAATVSPDTVVDEALQAWRDPAEAKTQAAQLFDWLMARAAKPDSLAARLFALTLSARCVERIGPLETSLGLSRAAQRALLARHFPGILDIWMAESGSCLRHALLPAAGLAWAEGPGQGHGHGHGGSASGATVLPTAGASGVPSGEAQLKQLLAEVQEEEKDDLTRLLLEHRAGPEPEPDWLAAIVVAACQRPNHLWEDMGYRSRADLSALFETFFPTLKARNDRDMKWKKFLYKQLCDRDDMHVCRAPTCDACDDFEACFGPEA